MRVAGMKSSEISDTRARHRMIRATRTAKSWAQTAKVSVESIEEVCPSCAKALRARGIKAIAVKQMSPEALAGMCDKFGADEGFFTRCTESSFGGEISDVDSFCAWLHHECIGKWPGERG